MRNGDRVQVVREIRQLEHDMTLAEALQERANRTSSETLADVLASNPKRLDILLGRATPGTRYFWALVLVNSRFEAEIGKAVDQANFQPNVRASAKAGKVRRLRLAQGRFDG